MKPTKQRVVGIGCLVLLVAYGIFLVVFFKTMPMRLAAMNDIRSRVKWTSQIMPNYNYELVIADSGNIFSTGYFGDVTCLDQNGSLSWENTLEGLSQTYISNWGMSALGDGRVVALYDQSNPAFPSPGGHSNTGSTNIEMRVIDANGTTTGQYPLASLQSLESLVANNAKLFTLDSSEVVFAYDLAGNLLWQYGTANQNVSRSINYGYNQNLNPTAELAILPVSKRLAMVVNGIDLTVLNTDGTLHATASIGQPNTNPLVAVGKNDEMYFAEFELHAVDTECKTTWKIQLSNPNVAVAALETGDDGSIYLCQENYSATNCDIICFDPNGNERWRTAVSNQCTLLAVAKDGTVYTAGYAPGLYSLDPQGNENWHLQYQNFYIQMLQVTPDGTILISDHSRTWALEP